MKKKFGKEEQEKLERKLVRACNAWIRGGGKISPAREGIDGKCCRCPFGAAIGDRVGHSYPIPEDCASELSIPVGFASSFTKAFDGEELKRSPGALAGRRFRERYAGAK